MAPEDVWEAIGANSGRDSPESHYMRLCDTLKARNKQLEQQLAIVSKNCEDAMYNERQLQEQLAAANARIADLETRATLMDRHKERLEISITNRDARITEITNAVRLYFTVINQANEDYCAHRYWFANVQRCSDMSWAFQKSLLLVLGGGDGKAGSFDGKKCTLDGGPDACVSDHCIPYCPKLKEERNLGAADICECGHVMDHYVSKGDRLSPRDYDYYQCPHCGKGRSG